MPHDEASPSEGQEYEPILVGGQSYIALD